MLKTRKSLLAVLIAMFVVASFGLAAAAQIDGLINGTPGAALPAGGSVAGGFSNNLDLYLNPGGLGDALIYTYYNADGMTTYFTVTNTDTNNAHRARVRFREGADVAGSTLCSVPMGSYELLDFDICLSKGDMWAGFIRKSATGEGEVCVINDDTTLVDPYLNTDSRLPAKFSSIYTSSCAKFKYGTENQNANNKITAQNTLEGYFEIIGASRITTVIAGKPTAQECRNAYAGTGGDVPNVLAGNTFLLDNEDGGTYAYNASALANFLANGIQSHIGTTTPQFNDASEGLSAVNYVLTKGELFSVYDLQSAQTGMVITLPTKLLTYTAACVNIFNDNRVSVELWDTNENKVGGTSCVGSPCVPQQFKLPYEVNVLQVNKTGQVDPNFFIKTQVGSAVKTDFDFGWIGVDFTEPKPLVPVHSTTIGATPSATTAGWPAIGMTLLNVDKGEATGSFPVQYLTTITNP